LTRQSIIRGMKISNVCLLLFFFAPAGYASGPKASDFNTTFYVDSFMYTPGDNHCRMQLHASGTTYQVEWRYQGTQIRGGCPGHRAGEQYQGRLKGGIMGYRIELLGSDKKGKPKAETWYVSGQLQ
jgi:hypothetical protein